MEKLRNLKKNEIPFHNFLQTYFIHLEENQADTTDHTSHRLQCPQYTAEFAFIISSTDSSKEQQYEWGNHTLEMSHILEENTFLSLFIIGDKLN